MFDNGKAKKNIYDNKKASSFTSRDEISDNISLHDFSEHDVIFNY